MNISGTIVDRDTAGQVSWLDRLGEGALEAALNNYLRFGPEEPGVQLALEDLRAVMSLVKAKAFVRAERALAGITERPEWFDWQEFEQSFFALRDTVAALDDRDADTALAKLSGARHILFAAEVANVSGTALIFKGELESAKAEFEQALALDPRHYRAVTNLGNAALEAGEIDAAIEFYNKAINLNSDFPNAHHNLGVAWRKKGNIARSISALKAGQKAQQRFEQAEAREQLGRMTRGISGGKSSAKYLKWIMYVAIGAGVYWFLSSRGTI